MGQSTLKPAHAVGLSDRQTTAADTMACPSPTFLQWLRLHVLNGHIGEDHRVAVVLYIDVQMCPQPNLL